ncbi:MAG: hypothetical protein GXP62_12565, partial [Oligoflexia bacterium]|nr:hypothetical protein [Oligoflexia bacterium]
MSTQPSSPRRRPLAWLVPTLAAVSLACGGLFSSTDDFSAVVDAPALVSKGQPFQVQVVIHNAADHPQVLDSLDIGDDWLAGVTVTGTTPPYSDASHIPLDGSWSYGFQEGIPAGGSLTVTLNATGVQTGSFR